MTSVGGRPGQRGDARLDDAGTRLLPVPVAVAVPLHRPMGALLAAAGADLLREMIGFADERIISTQRPLPVFQQPGK